jgi:hypothetical protein
VLKTKLAVLREADLNGFKNYYDNQLKALSDRVAEKESIIAATRDKLHD